jgi:hypothetical protein
VTEQPAVTCGIDWAERHHDVALVARLILLGPIALRLKAVVPVAPGLVVSVVGPDDAPSQLQQQLLGGGPGQGVGGGGRYRGSGPSRRSLNDSRYWWANGTGRVNCAQGVHLLRPPEQA